MKVWGMAADYSGCWHYRIRLPLCQLAKLGHDIGWAQGLIPDHLVDVIIGQRVCREEISEAWQDMARRRRCKLVYEIDDDLFTIPPSSRAAYRVYGSPDVQDRIKRNAEVADAVFVSTPTLAKVMGEYNGRVYVLPNCVPAGLRSSWRSLDSRILLGWAGSGTHAIDFASLPTSLFRMLNDPRIAAIHTVGGQNRLRDGAIRVRVGRDGDRRIVYADAGEGLVHGGGDFFTPRGVDPRKVVRTQWMDNLGDYYKALIFDICLIPLADLPFNQAKSSIKFLELAALGTPVIASAVGPYAADIEHGVTGFLASSNRDWTRYLNRLLGSSALRSRIGRQAREWSRQWTIEGNVWRWEQALTEILES